MSLSQVEWYMCTYVVLSNHTDYSYLKVEHTESGRLSGVKGGCVQSQIIEHSPQPQEHCRETCKPLSQQYHDNSLTKRLFVQSLVGKATPQQVAQLPLLGNAFCTKHTINKEPSVHWANCSHLCHSPPTLEQKARPEV